MLSWATSQFEKLSQTVAPPPDDPAGQFAYRCQRGDEDGAMEMVSQLPYGMDTIVVPTKERSPLHQACACSMLKLTRLLLTQPGATLEKVDKEGNTALHCAAMGTGAATLDVVKLLVQEMNADVSLKNATGQTPYDVASLNAVRQFLLPLQLQKETQEALANGGQGLIPGMDMGGLKISGGGPPPPPTMAGPGGMTSPPPVGQPTSAAPTMMASGPAGMPPPPMSGGMPPPPISGSAMASPPAAPTSGEQGYARVGSSSAAIYKPSGRNFVQPDGFHSSSSDKRLQQKYGHANVNNYAVPPPPKSGNSSGSVGYVGSTSTIGSTPSGGANPYAGGYQFRNSARGGSRYVSYDAVTGQQAPAAPRSAGYPNYMQQSAPLGAAPNVAVFTPGGAASPMPAQSAYNYNNTPIQSAPVSAPPQQQPLAHSTSAPAPAYEHQQAGHTMMNAQPPVPLQIVTPAPGTDNSLPPPPISGLGSSMTPSTNMNAAEMFATPQPPTPKTVEQQPMPSTQVVSQSNEPAGNASFPAPPISNFAQTSSAAAFPAPPIGLVTSSSPEAAAAAFASPAKSDVIPPVETTNASPQISTTEALSSPPTAITSDHGAAAKAFASAPVSDTPGSAPETTVETAPPAENATEPTEFSEVPLSDVPLDTPQPETKAPVASMGGLPPPPMSTGSAADLFSSPPPTS